MEITKHAPIHVVYIITKLELGGAQKVCLSLVEGLASSEDAGIQASLVSGQHGELVGQVHKYKTVYLLSSLNREVRLSKIWHEIKTFFALIKLLKTLRKEHKNIIVHTHSTKAGIIGRWAAFFARVKKRVHTIHGFGFHDYQSWPTWLAVYMCELCTSLITTHFICVSQKDHQKGSRLFPRFAKKSSLIRAAVDDRFFLVPARRAEEKPSKKQRPFIIGTISCFKPQKNLFDLLQAFKTVHSRCIQAGFVAPQLYIIGDGEQRKQIESWIAKNNLNAAIVLLGWQKDVLAWLRSWDVFALSSLWEGLPCSVIEARLNGLPVVAYDVGGIREVVSEGINGFLVTPGHWQDLADRLFTLATDKTLYQKCVQHQDGLTDYSNASMVTHHIALYKQLGQRR